MTLEALQLSLLMTNSMFQRGHMVPDGDCWFGSAKSVGVESKVMVTRIIER